MTHPLSRHWIPCLVCIVVTLLLLGQIQTSGLAASPIQEASDIASIEGTGEKLSTMALVGPPNQQGADPNQPANPSVCPASPAGLPNTIDRANFCVYYNNTNTTQAQATNAANDTQNYWTAYTTNFGFLAPLITTGSKIEVRILSNPACNGEAWDNYISVHTGCFGTAEERSKAIGHELFHRVQFHYDSGWANWNTIGWMYEGTARAMEDMTFANIDNWAGSMTAAFSFNQEVNNYLAMPNSDITSFPMRYMSCLWWKYFSEQYGSTTTEPQRGVDAFLRLWQAVSTNRNITAVNNALTTLGANTNFDTAFRRFIVANYTKDLTSLPNNSYNYIDEEETNNPSAYGPLTPANGGTISSTKSASWNNRAISRYGAGYYKAKPDSTCKVVTVSFHRNSGSTNFYHIVTQKGTTNPIFAAHKEGSGADWKQSFLNDGISGVVAIAGSQSSSSNVNVSISCANPVVNIKLPNSTATANVGPYDKPGKFLIQLLITNGSASGPVVAGLTKDDFSVKVNSKAATVTTGGFIQEQYWLVVKAPTQTANGTYDLQVNLEKPGTNVTIATATNSKSIVYASDNLDYALVIDRSGSMGWGTNPRINAAKGAASLYVDITRDNDGLAIVPFEENVNPTPFAMQKVNATVRSNAKTYIQNITASGWTSIGDGLNEAANQRKNSTTGNKKCSFVLLSDGMQNRPQYWADVKATVKAANCPVTSIAFGPDSDETLMQQIAKDTGGLYYYNDVYVSTASHQPGDSPTPEDMALDLSNYYEFAQASEEGRQRLLAEKGVMPDPPVEQTHRVTIDDSVDEAVFALDWTYASVEMELRLRKPDGSIIDGDVLPYTFLDWANGHMGWRISDPDPGAWELLVMNHGGGSGTVPYQVIVSGHSNLTLFLMMPDRLGGDYVTGNGVPIYALLSSDTPITGQLIHAIVTAPDGSNTTITLLDDGQHGDGDANDGVYANIFTGVNQAWEVSTSGEDDPQTPPDQGGYRVKVQVNSADFQRQSLGGFAVTEDADDNNNGLPDSYEQQYGTDDPDGDPDLDMLRTLDEYLAGTNPRNSDTDGGGENDGSEVIIWGQDPHNPDDDQIGAPAFFTTNAQIGSVLLTYDVQADYETIVLYRSVGSDGPWDEIGLLSLTGIHTDTVPNDVTYYYRLMAANAINHFSAVVPGEPATPREDPWYPEARVVINNREPETSDPNVVLNFVPYEPLEPGQHDTFSDITEMLLSNEPGFTGAQWQPFAQDVPWTLAAATSGYTHVYARFRDAFGNESVGGAVGTIFYYSNRLIYLPLIVR